MTGLYRESRLEGYRLARVRLERAEKSLASLINQHSVYADEHRALIAIYKKIVKVFADSPEEMPTHNLEGIAPSFNGE
jgi:hypothetical protein